MNPILITWEPRNDWGKKQIQCPIAAIFHINTSEKDIERMMMLLHANYSSCGADRQFCVSPYVSFAKRKYPCKAYRYARLPYIYCGDNPRLFARRVFDLTLADEGGFNELRWEENAYRGERLLPDRTCWMYSARTNAITRIN
jgi:hypothetical protein